MLSAQTFHSLVLEAEGGFAAPQYGAAAALRLGYELKHKHLLFHLALGAAYHYTTTSMPDYDEMTPAVDSEEYRLLAHSYYSHRVDSRQWMDLQASVQIGGEWEKIYFLAGIIPSFYIYGKEDIRADIRVTGDYEKFIDIFEDMPNHGFTTMPYHTTVWNGPPCCRRGRRTDRRTYAFRSIWTLSDLPFGCSAGMVNRH